MTKRSGAGSKRSRGVALAGAAVAVLWAIALPPAGEAVGPTASTPRPHSTFIALPAASTSVAAAKPTKPTKSRKQTYSSPGYHWNGKLPKVAPTLPGKVIHLGDGVSPHIVVDAAGTGQIAYTTSPNPSSTAAGSAVRDCVLKRGQSNCAANQSLVPPATTVGYSIDDDGPSPLVLGNQLLMLSHRFPDEVAAPDNTSVYPTWLWTSDDGGKTFTGPGMVGQLGASGNAITYGGSNPMIAWISDDMTGGTWFQATSAGAYQGQRLNLSKPGTNSEAYNGRLAVDGNRPVAEFTDLSNNIFIREWNGAGDIMQAANWSLHQMKGQGYTRLVSGPSGVFLLFQKTFSGKLFVQRIVNGSPSGAALAVTPSTDYNHANYAITEDASGQLIVGWFVNSNTLDVRTSSDGGKVWGAVQTVARHLNEPSDLQLGAAQDGGGFAAFSTPEPGGVSHSQIDVAAFGTFAATGLKGLGNLTGDGAGGLGGDPLASTSCTDAHFGDIDAIAEAGCFLRDPDNPTSGAAVSTGEVRLNGLQLIPDAGVKIVIDPKQHTINTTGEVSVVLRAPGIGDITLYHGELHLDLAGDLADVGNILFDPDLSQAASTLEGFPFSGTVDVQIQHDAVVIPVALTLPPYMGGITASATLLANNATGFELKSLHIGVADLPLGALEITNLNIDYTSDGDVWKGSAHLNIPAGSPYFSIDASVEFDDGDFTMGSFHVDVPYPGIPIFEDTFITGFGGSFDIHPTHKVFTGSIDLGAIQADPPNYVLGVSGVVSITFQDNGPVIVQISGSGSVHGQQIATASAEFRTDGFFELKGELDLDLTLVSISANIDAFADLPSGTFSAELKGTLDTGTFDIASVDGIVSSKGAGACGTYLGFSAGFGYTWGGSAHLFLDDCDFGPYRVAPPAAALSHQRGMPAGEVVRDATIASGTSVVNFEVHGTDGAPNVTLTDPKGNSITPVALTSTTGKNASFQVADPAHDVTYVAVKAPRAGNWQVAAAAGSVPITQVLTTRGYAAPKVSAHVSGHGQSRSLSYHVSGPPTLKVAFEEKAAHSYGVIGTARAAHGTLHFTPAAGPAGRRTIIAVLSENGVPVRHVTVASYRAPAPARPGKVSKLRVRRHGHKFRITFGSARGAARYTVHAVASDGHRFTWVVYRGAHSRTVPVLGYTDRVSVTVAGISSQQKIGPAAKASASYQSPVYKKAHRKHHKRHRK
jgi:hypothetical protein